MGAYENLLVAIHFSASARPVSVHLGAPRIWLQRESIQIYPNLPYI